MRECFYELLYQSSFSNIKQVRSLNEKLADLGHSVTYDWTQNERTSTLSDLQRIAQLEKAAVQQSTIFIMLLPAGKGSHVEYGIALAQNKFIVLYSPQNEALDFETTTTFYHLPNVTIVTGDENELVKTITEIQNSLF